MITTASHATNLSNSTSIWGWYAKPRAMADTGAQSVPVSVLVSISGSDSGSSENRIRPVMEPTGAGLRAAGLDPAPIAASDDGLDHAGLEATAETPRSRQG